MIDSLLNILFAAKLYFSNTALRRFMTVSGVCDCSKVKISNDRLYILYENQWLPVCTPSDAKTVPVACRMLGFDDRAWSAGIWRSITCLYLECNGDEDNVFDCPTVLRKSFIGDIVHIGCKGVKDCTCPAEPAVKITTELQFMQNGDSNGTLDIIPQLLFVCNFTVVDHTEYQIEWDINGESQPVLGPGKDLRLMGLHENDLLKVLGESPVHGTQIKCGMAILSNSTQGKRTMSYSDPLVIGAQVKEPVIYLSKTGVSFIEIEFNVPVACGYTVERNETPSFPCLYSLQLNSKYPWTCSKGGVASIVTNPKGNIFCTEPIKLLERPEDWIQKSYSHTLEISTSDSTYEDDEDYTLELKFDDTIRHRLWKNYVFPEIKVEVTDAKSNLNKICYSQIDPHMRSADSTYYEHHKTGTFIFYRNSKNKVEVQEKLIGCGGRYYRARCACAVAVRAGADVFMINLCGSINFIGFTKCDDGGLLDVKMLDLWKFQVNTPTGTRLEIQINTLIPRTVNIVMYMSPKDKHRTEGECGEFDGDGSNDFKHRDGTFTSNTGVNRQSPDAFSESWEVSEEESLFLTPDIELESWENFSKEYCLCKRSKEHSSESVCSRKQDFGCREKLSITRKKCKVTSRKRSTSGQNVGEMRRLFTLMTTKRGERKKREAEANITEEEAKILCSAINESLVATNFTAISGDEDIQAVVSQCEMDVVEMNDPFMAQMHIDALNNIARNMLDFLPTYTSNNTDDVQYFLANSCPRNCSGQGQCAENGTCTCEEGYGGADCSIDLSEPLTIDDIEGGGLCDTAYGDDCLCFTVRTDSLLEGFTCSVDVLEIPGEGVEVFSKNVFVTGDYEDVFTGVCCLSDEKSLTTALASKLRFAISNDGVNYGASVDVVVYDSTCQTVNVTDKYTVSLKDNFCFIDGHCVEHLTSRTAANCSICDADISVDRWTSLCPNSSDAKDTHILIIALSITTAVLGFIVLAGLSIFIWKRCTVQKKTPNLDVVSTTPTDYDKVGRTAFGLNTRDLHFGYNLGNSYKLMNAVHRKNL